MIHVWKTEMWLNKDTYILNLNVSVFIQSHFGVSHMDRFEVF